MIGSFFFISWRIGQLITLIPMIGMLAWFVDGFLDANMLTPDYILVLFIVSVLAAAWCVQTLLRFGATRRSAHFVALIDLCIVGAFIAGVYLLGRITVEDCPSFRETGEEFLASLGPFGYFGQRTGNPRASDSEKVCAMLKTCFGLGIMNVLGFCVTAGLAWLLQKNDDEHYHRGGRGHGTRRGHRRRRSGSSRRTGDYHV